MGEMADWINEQMEDDFSCAYSRPRFERHGYRGPPCQQRKIGNKCDCGGTIVTRKNKNTGTTFSGCSNFPVCRFSQDAVIDQPV